MNSEEYEIYKFIKNSIYSARTKADTTEDKYHHNTSYSFTPKVIKHGLLSLNEKRKIYNLDLDEETMFKLNDENYVNGTDDISLSVVGLPDVDENDFEYNPFSYFYVDIIISKYVKARRNSKNYANEFLVSEKINNSDFRAIDIRLLEYVKKTFTDPNISSDEKRKRIIECYNYLRKIAIALKEAKLNIPLREMSNGNITLDKEKVSCFKKLKV